MQLECLILTLKFSSSFKSWLFLNLSSTEEPRGHFWCLLICRTSGLGEIAAPTRLPLVKQMRHSLDWWSDWSPGCEDFFPLAGTRSLPRRCPPRVSSAACASAVVSTCVLVVNPPVRFCTVCSRGQSKECRRVGQSGHQRANQSVMDFPVTDTQLGSPSSRCRSQLEVFLGLSVSKVVGALCATTLKLQDCQKHGKVIILKPWLCFSSLLRLLTFLPVATKNTFPEKTPGTLGCLAEKTKNKTQPKTLDCFSQIWEAELEKSQEELIKC